MDKKIKKKWLKALRSGEYKQSLTALKFKNTFCCLGVLCDLHSKETGNKWNAGHYLEHDGVLPIEVVDWATLPDGDPDIKSNNGVTLSDANDRGQSFKQIANIIENQL